MPILGFGVYQMRECAQPIAAAFKAGYRHIDSAQIYRNEDQVGEAFRASGLPREAVFITTKVSSRNQGYNKTIASVDQSLKTLGLDYVDLFLIHDPLSGKVKRLETYKALLEKKEAGKIRSVGVSNYGVPHLEEIKSADLPAPTVNQIELHPWCQQRPIVEYCQKNNIVVEAYSPLTRGDYLNDPTLQAIAKTHNKEPAQVLIRWSLQKGYSPLPKSATPSRVASNADVYSFSLSEEEMAKLDAQDKAEKGAVTWNPVNAE
ncbi:Aldo/keto reductase [Dacryopinax primogenitus]|uniref:Aldo/keto reductase n=1 Tax=Dacryopinax primogenitus (strain DJM 731) TaxID=1858805 RepID=M5G0R5_DACPD|nr:Aldo/keto reductase [Dacryopinax primogenitus]EJU03846.1 Aldo/keto reductase [Dacryopinax primogenitus]